MLPVIEQLLVLQDRDRKARALKQELKLVPIQRKELDEKLANAQREFENARLKGREIEVERKKLENEAQTKRDQIARFQAQKFQTRKNEEFAALSHEIERAEKDIMVIEDRELELMDAGEKMKVTVAENEKTALATKAQVERMIADLDAKKTALESQLGELSAEREKLSAGIDEDLLDTYQRLFANKGEAVVALEREICTGCHMKVVPTTVGSVRARKVVTHCEQCGRILYAAS